MLSSSQIAKATSNIIAVINSFEKYFTKKNTAVNDIVYLVSLHFATLFAKDLRLDLTDAQTSNYLLTNQQDIQAGEIKDILYMAQNKAVEAVAAMSHYEIEITEYLYAENTILLPSLVFDTNGRTIKKDKDAKIEIPAPIVHIDINSLLQKTEEAKKEMMAKIDQSFSLIPRPDAVDMQPISTQIDDLLNYNKEKQSQTELKGESHKKELKETLDRINKDLIASGATNTEHIMALFTEMSNVLMAQISRVEEVINSREYSPVIELQAPEQRVIVEKDFTDIFRQLNSIKAEINETIRSAAQKLQQPKEWVFTVKRDSNDLMTTVTAISV